MAGCGTSAQLSTRRVALPSGYDRVKDRCAVWTRRPPRVTRALGVAGAMVWLSGCSDGSDPRQWRQEPLTLAWDQPDGLAEYFHVRAGIQLLRTEQPTVTLRLAPGTHTIYVEACNAAACSEPAVVEVSWQEPRWVLASAAGEGATAVQPMGAGNPAAGQHDLRPEP